MKLPAPDQYREAMFNPRLAFVDPDLKFAECEKDHWDLPKIMTGGFAAIFHLHRGNSQWAVRCFYKDIPELRRRYDAIGQFLTKYADGVFVSASLLRDGILVQGQRYPIIKMTWIDGDPLNLYIERNISKRQTISWLPDAFLELTKKLQNLGIAHGDLQHGNIMVTDHSLKLIDYDGLYLPQLRGLRNNQQGHPNYQLPLRGDEYGPEIDRFSEIVIHTALRAVVGSPSLWKKYSNGENLLFKQSDFEDPDSSELMSDLEQISEVGSLVPKLKALCALRTGDVPVLDDLFSGRWQPPVVIPRAVVPPQRLRPIYEVLDASNITDLLARVGRRVTIVGQIIDVHEATTRYGQPYVFFNFGDWRRGAFQLVVWSGALGLLNAEGLRTSSYRGKWISITGILSSYKGRPQVEVEMPSQIEVLSGRREASDRIKGILPTRPKLPSKIGPRELRKLRVLNYVVAHRDEYPSANTIAKALGVPPDAIIDLLDELVREGKIKRDSTTRGPVEPPPRPFPSGPRHLPPQVPTTTRTLDKKDADMFNRLWGKRTGQTVPPAPQQPITSSPVTKLVPSPNLCAAGTLLVALALLLAVLRAYTASLVFVVSGCSAVYYALTHYSILVPAKVMSQTWAYAHFGGWCRGCGSTIQTGSQIVKTERGWVHSSCVGNVKKRVWRRL
jgi:serine/threonine protein kinase